MNLTRLKILAIYLLGLILSACEADNVANEPVVDDTVVGFTQVDIVAVKNVVRGGETVFGNLVADAMFYYANQQGLNVDAALVNGGNLRFDSGSRPDGVYPAGQITRDNINEMLPFRNNIWVMTLTGAQLRSVFERSVHALPVPEGSSGSGAFIQVSAQIQLVYDLSQQPQLLDELVTPPVIATQGERLQSMLINGGAILDNRDYRILLPEFIGAGGDGFIALGETTANNIEATNFVTAEALEAYLRAFSPVAPQIENRVSINQ